MFGYEAGELKKAAAKISPSEILPPAGMQTETQSNVKKCVPAGSGCKQKNKKKTHT